MMKQWNDYFGTHVYLKRLIKYPEITNLCIDPGCGLVVKTRPTLGSLNPVKETNIPRFQACPEAVAMAKEQGAQGPEAEEQWDAG